MRFVKYTISVPKQTHAELDEYIECVLRNIYSLTDSDLWFLFSPDDRPKESDVKLLKETDTQYIIQFDSVSSTALVNVLPESTNIQPIQWYPNNRLYNDVKYLIVMEVQNSSSGLGEFYESINVPSDEVLFILKQLVIDNIVQKFVSIDPTFFICSSNNVPLYFGVEKGEFIVSVASDISFDIDNGFIGNEEYIELLNVYFNKWKLRGNLCSPIIPPNNISGFGSSIKRARVSYYQ